MCHYNFTRARTTCSHTYTSLFSALSTVRTTLASHPCLYNRTVALTSIQLFAALFHFSAICCDLFGYGHHHVRSCPTLDHCINRVCHLPKITIAYSLRTIGHSCCNGLFPLGPKKVVPTKPSLPCLRKT